MLTGLASAAETALKLEASTPKTAVAIRLRRPVEWVEVFMVVSCVPSEKAPVSSNTGSSSSLGRNLLGRLDTVRRSFLQRMSREIDLRNQRPVGDPHGIAERLLIATLAIVGGQQVGAHATYANKPGRVTQPGI